MILRKENYVLVFALLLGVKGMKIEKGDDRVKLVHDDNGDYQFILDENLVDLVLARFVSDSQPQIDGKCPYKNEFVKKDGKYDFYLREGLDYEKSFKYSCVIGDFSTHVILNNVNDETPDLIPAPCFINENTTYTMENAPCSFIIQDKDKMYKDTKVTISDKETKDLFTFKFKDGDNNEGQDTASIYILPNELLDYEKKTIYVLHAVVNDGANENNATLIINVKDIADTEPKFINLKNIYQIKEKEEFSFTVEAIDGDYEINSKITYEGIDIPDIIKVNKTTGIVVIPKIDRDKQEYPDDTITLKIRATEVLEPYMTADADIVINIQDVNDNKPVIISVNGKDTPKDRKVSMDLNENSKTIDFVIEIEDKDSIIYNQYSVNIVNTKQKADTAFQILPNVGHAKTSSKLSITNPALLDYENKDWQVIEFDIETIDQNKKEFIDVLHITINLINLNDEAPVLDNLPNTTTVEETIKENQPIYEVKSHDPDNPGMKDKTVYSISGSNSLKIDPDTGIISTKTAKAFDYQKSHEVEIRVTATDLNKNSNSETLTIKVEDVNNLPPEIQTLTEPIEILENQKPNTMIKSDTIKAFDMDTTCSLTPRIDWKQTKFQKNFGDIKDVKDEYFFLDVVSKNVKNSNYPCYMEISFKTNKNANPKEGDGGVPNYEKFDVINLVLIVKDENTEFGNKETAVTLQIHIKDENDETPYFTIKELERTVWENISIGKIETIVARDEDTNDELTYSLIPKNESADHPDWIVIDKHSGEVSIPKDAQIDCDDEKIFELNYECEVVDLKMHKASIPVKIKIQDTNNKSPNFTIDKEYSIKENKKDFLLFDINPMDGDRDSPNHDVQCEFNDLSRDCARYFSVNEKNEIKSSPETVIDYETIPKMQCTIKCHDFGSPKLTSTDGTFNVIVIDVNDHPPHFDSNPKFAVSESLKKGETVQTLKASDEDSGVRGQLEFEIIEQDKDKLFNLSKVNDKSTDLKATKALRDFYGEKKITIKITDCKDCTEEEDKRLSITQELTITINKYNFDQPQIVFPKENDVYILANKQKAGEALSLFNSDKTLEDFKGYNEKEKCTKKWKTMFSFTTSDYSDYFKLIQHPDTCSATLTVTDTYVKNNPKDLRADFEITYEITDKAADNQIKEEPRKQVLKKVTFKFLDANADPFFNEKTNTIEFIEEDEHDAPKKVDHAQYPNEINLNIIYEIDQEYDYFNYSVEDSTIYLLEPLDYETTKQHQIRLIAKKDRNSQPGNDGILTIIINVKDINDNPPIFEKDTFIGGLMSGQKNSDPVILKATDADDVSKGTLKYSMSNFKKSGKSLDKITESNFDLTGEEKNQLKANFEVLTSMSGYFTFTAIVTDAKVDGHGPFTSKANVKIFIITPENTVDLKFENTLKQVEDQRECMLANITEVLGYESSKYAIVQDKNSNEEITTATLYFVDTDNYELLTKSDVMKKLSNIKTFRTLRDELRKCDNLVLQSFDSENNNDEDLTAVLKAWLIGVTVVLGTLCLIMLVIFFLKTRQLKNRISNLTTTKFGSQESGLNRINVPTTNVNAVEGANAIFNTKIEDFTRHSTLSGESDLVGIEDNPEFDMDFNPDNADDNYI